MIVMLTGGKDLIIAAKVYFQVKLDKDWAYTLIARSSIFYQIFLPLWISANFVTNDLEEEPTQFKEEKQKQQRRRSVTFNEEVEVRYPVLGPISLLPLLLYYLPTLTVTLTKTSFPQLISNSRLPHYVRK